MKSNPERRWWDLAAAFLLIAAMSIAASRLVATEWTYDLKVTQTMAFLGVLAGLALGYSRFSPRFTAILASVYGIVAVFWQLGLTIDQDVLWSERMFILANRAGVVIYQLINQETVQNSILFLILMYALFWAISAYAAYTLVRYGDAWRAVIPGGIAIFIIHFFDPYLIRRSWYLAAYIFFSLIIIARMTFLQRQNRWQQSRTALPPHLGLDFIRFTILATSIVVIFAWTVPAMANALPAAQKAWDPIKSAWIQTRERFDYAFASLRPSVALVTDYYGLSTTLGRGSPLADTIMFTVDAPPGLPPGARLYWRARSYETYENGSWLTTINNAYEFNPEESDLPITEYTGRWLGSFNFTSATTMNTLFTPAQPLWVNRPGRVEYIENPDGTVDISSFHASPNLEDGQEYRVQASISYASIEQLRAAGTEYPEWITERYLELPPSITPRTIQLAQDITEGRETPYDKVAAVTNYLRQNITYVDTIEEDIPLNQERIDWFLFDYQQGFCNYYSTAEIILLRAIGIPARWAVGYAQGQRMESEESLPGAAFESGSYLIRQHDAHAWPEVYFPGIGWVEFEPTASEPDISRLESNPLEGNPLDPAATQPYAFEHDEFDDKLEMLREERDLYTAPDTPWNWMRLVYWTLPFILLAGLVYLGWRYRTRIQWLVVPIYLESVFHKVGIQPPKKIQLWSRRATLPPLSRAYHEINHALSRLGHNPLITDTPEERADQLAELIPPSESAAKSLVGEYNIEVFSNQPANLVIAIKSANQIKRLSFEALLKKIISSIKKPFELIQRGLQRGSG